MEAFKKCTKKITKYKNDTKVNFKSDKYHYETLIPSPVTKSKMTFTLTLRAKGIIDLQVDLNQCT